MSSEEKTDEKRTAKLLNDVCRHSMIERLYRDILCDLAVCEIEGWDKGEYIRMLKDRLNSFGV